MSRIRHLWGARSLVILVLGLAHAAVAQENGKQPKDATKARPQEHPYELHAFILSKEKKITWTFTDHKNFTEASQVWAIEPPSKPAAKRKPVENGDGANE